VKTLATYFLLIILPIISHGQNQIGIKGGYIFYWFTNPDDSHFTADYDYSHNAYSTAIIIRQRIPDSLLNIGLEIEYTQRSFSVKSSWGGLGGSSDANYSYTIGNLYLHFQPQFTFGTKLKYYFCPGFYIGTLLNSKLNGSLSYWQMGNPPTSGTKIVNGSARGYYPGFEFGVYPGFGFELPIDKNLNFLFDYRFTMNFLPMGGSWGSDKVKMLNMNFQIGASYNLHRSAKSIKTIRN
jgi:hypothetical protein